MFSFILLLSLNVIAEDLSVSTHTYTPENIVYDIDFTKKVIEYFSDPVNCKTNILNTEDKREEVYEFKKIGFYRTELVFMLEMCCEKEIDTQIVLNEIKNSNRTIFDIARENKYNITENFNRSEEVKKNIEKESVKNDFLKNFIDKYFK